jgi:hypothetical protein
VKRLLFAGLILSLSACEKHPTEEPFGLKRAQFGVFYGPEIQELTEIPLETDAPGRGMVLRLTFRAPPDPPRKVRWELERPRKPQPLSQADAGTKSARSPAPDEDAGLALDRIVQFGEVSTRPGESILDVPLAFRPGDPLGDWSIRVTLDDQVVLNRPFRVVRPKPKKRDDPY